MQTRDMTLGIRNGDEGAFNAFYECYSNRMYQYLIVLSKGDEELARDAHQNSLIRVIRYVRPFGSDDELWRYLTVVMRTAHLDLVRRNATRARATGKLPPSQPLEEDAGREQLLDLLEEGLAALPEEDRRLLEAHYHTGTPQAELAAAHTTTVKALGMKLHRLRGELRSFIMRGLRHG
jgi:RNA polymerase sigma factor (sigma-70 family)